MDRYEIQVLDGYDNITYADGITANNIITNESYQSLFTSANGCDSSITENLNIVSVNPILTR